MLFDGHAHLANETNSLNRLLATMNTLEISKTVIVAGGSLTPLELSTQIARGTLSNKMIDNETILRQTGQADGRLFPFYFANPCAGVDEYHRLGSRFYGLKLGPAVHGIALNDPRTRAFIEVAMKFNHPVYLHCLARTGFEVVDLVTLARDFPKVNFILGHAGVGNLDLYALTLIQSEPHIYFETSGGFSFVIQEACRLLGSHRVIFGSEYPLQHPAVEIEKIRRLELSEADYFMVMGKNIEFLLMGGQPV